MTSLKPPDKDLLRYFLKDNIRLTIDFRKTDQSKGTPPPPLEKPFPETAKRIDLLPPENWANIKDVSLISAIKNRKSHRVFKASSLTLEELSFLLWATQGIRQIVNSGTALRTVPSAGARHSFETYLIVLNVENLEQGVYRYSAVEHQLVLERIVPELRNRIVDASYGQSFVGRAPVSLVWTTIPYRMEWRYDKAAHKVIAIDAGHVCQNLYLAVEAIGAGTCAIAAYHQELMDELLGVDSEDEFAVYMAAVGKL